MATQWLTTEEIETITNAVLPQITLGGSWCLIKNRSLADLRSTTERNSNPVPNGLAADEVQAVTDAFRREVTTDISWVEIEERSLADLCSSNQDALIDDLYEDHPDDRPFRSQMADTIRVYDRLLETDRATEIPCEKCGHAHPEIPAN